MKIFYQNNWQLLILPLMIAAISSCEQPVCCDPGPPSFLAVIRTTEGFDYLTAHADDSFELYYYQNEEKMNLEVFAGLHKDTTFLEGINVTPLSAEGIKDFYLKVGNDIDTLFVDVEHSKKWEYKAVRFNGQPAQEIRSSKAAPFWLLQKE